MRVVGRSRKSQRAPALVGPDDKLRALRRSAAKGGRRLNGATSASVFEVQGRNALGLLRPYGPTHSQRIARMDPDFIRELFAPFRPVAVKRMFGGVGIYADGLMFGLVFDDVIYLRVDQTSIPSFEREARPPFVYPFASTMLGPPSRHV